MTVLDGTIDIDFVTEVDNAKISAIEVISRGGFISTLSIADPTPASVQEGDGASTTFDFPLTFDIAPAGPVTIAYEVDINGVITTDTVTLSGDGSISVTVDDDDIDDGDDVVAVTLTGIDAGDAVIDGDAASATATVTEDDGAAPSVVSLGPS